MVTGSHGHSATFFCPTLSSVFPGLHQKSPATHLDQARLCAIVDVEPKPCWPLYVRATAAWAPMGKYRCWKITQFYVAHVHVLEFQERLLPFSGHCHHLWRRSILEIETAAHAGVFYFLVVSSRPIQHHLRFHACRLHDLSFKRDPYLSRPTPVRSAKL